MHEDINKYRLIGDLGSALISERAILRGSGGTSFLRPVTPGLLGTTENRIWSLAPKTWRTLSRLYLPGTFVLETGAPE
jgi:hypothetical protein